MNINDIFRPYFTHTYLFSWIT